jgi:hypothetical protein
MRQRPSGRISPLREIMGSWWRPDPRVYYHIYQLEPVYEQVPYLSPGTPEGEQTAIRHTEWLAEVAFALRRKAIYVLVKVSEFDVNGHAAYRHEAVLTSWNEHGPEVPPDPVPVPNYPHVPLDELRYNLMSPPDEIEDDIDKLLETMIDWEGFTCIVATP